MKKEYLKPASTVVAVAPVKLLIDPSNPDPIFNPKEETDDGF